VNESIEHERGILKPYPNGEMVVDDMGRWEGGLRSAFEDGPCLRLHRGAGGSHEGWLATRFRCEQLSKPVTQVALNLVSVTAYRRAREHGPRNPERGGG
jgi:hypothetical protein